MATKEEIFKEAKFMLTHRMHGAWEAGDEKSYEKILISLGTLKGIEDALSGDEGKVQKLLKGFIPCPFCQDGTLAS